MTAKAYPRAPRGEVVDVLHGERVPDPYRWLEDPDSRATKKWVAQQATLLERRRKDWNLREPLRERIEELLGSGFQGTPTWRKGRQFFLRRTPDQQHPVLRTTDPDGVERILLDPMTIDSTGGTTLDAWHPSPDGSLLAYQLSESGSEESLLRVLDVCTGAVVDGPLERTRYSPVAWLPDGSGFFYVRQLPADQLPEDEVQYHRRVWLHRLGTPLSDDRLVFGEDRDKEMVWGVSLSRDGRWLVVTGARGTDPRTDVYLADLADGLPDKPDFVTLREDVDCRTAAGVGLDGRLYVWTDEDAPRGRLLVGDPKRPQPEHWRVLIEEDPEAVLGQFVLLNELERPQLAVTWTRHAVGEIGLYDAETGSPTGTITLPGPGTVGGLSTRYEGGHELWFSYTDHVTPPLIERFDARTREVYDWAEPPGAVPDTSGISVRQVEYQSFDGTVVRMFVVCRDDLAGTPQPTILNGYGGFGIPMTPAYSASALAWVEAGGHFAVACLRGGGEEGEDWHRAGMLDQKQRVFDDLHAAAEWLVTEGWTAPERLGILGGSNGGLLVGAAITQRPDLYRSAVCSAPLLDMVRYEQHGLGRFWSGEYGSASDPDQLRVLLTYSPYHRVQDGLAYPATLFTVFGSDTRVDPLHARKMCAALQAATTGTVDEAPILLRVETDVGHGARSVDRSVELSADQLAFHAWATGLGVPAEQHAPEPEPDASSEAASGDAGPDAPTGTAAGDAAGDES